MNMDMTSLEAMLVRARGAHDLLKHGYVDGPTALALIVLPSEETLAASMQVALENGPSGEAIRLAGLGKKRGPYKRRRAPEYTPKPLRDYSRGILLDDLLASIT